MNTRMLQGMLGIQSHSVPCISLLVRAHGWYKPPPHKGLHPSASIWDNGCSRSATYRMVAHLGTPQCPKDDNWLSKLCIHTSHTSPQMPLQTDCISFQISTGGIQLFHKKGLIPPSKEKNKPAQLSLIFCQKHSGFLTTSRAWKCSSCPNWAAQQPWVKT